MADQPRTFLTAEWRMLAMLNYEVAPALLQPFVPYGTELDQWMGRCFLSVVGFRFLRTRVMGIAIPLHRDFDEVNLRFYVRRRVEGEWRRGVVFVKELVPRRAIAWLARAFYGERYQALPMRHALRLPEGGEGETGRVCYEWRQGGRWSGLRVGFAGSRQPVRGGSEECFITEHYWGYAAQRNGSTLEYQVEHPRWSVWRATGAFLDCDVAALYGPQFAEPLAATPTSAFVADGSKVLVRRARVLEAD